jgi:hypothetical protein
VQCNAIQINAIPYHTIDNQEQTTLRLQTVDINAYINVIAYAIWYCSAL